MSRAAKIVLTLVALVVALAAGAGITFWRHPLATLAWLGRQRLRSEGFKKRTHDSAVGPQRVFVAGGGAPIVLLHGAGDQAGTWAKVAPLLSRAFSVVAVDLAGHGESAPASGPIPFGTLLAGLDGAMKEVPNGKVTLLGHSLGAWLACVWAKEHPDRVGRLVLVNGGPLRGDRPDLTLQPKTRAEAERTILALRDPSAPLIPEFVVEDVIREASRGPIARLAADAKGMETYLLDGKLGSLTIPVDLVWGASDQLLSLDYAHRLAGQLSAARLTTVPKCGHVPQVECPDGFAETLLKVLKDPLLASPVPAGGRP